MPIVPFVPRLKLKNYWSVTVYFVWIIYMRWKPGVVLIFEVISNP